MFVVVCCCLLCLLCLLLLLFVVFVVMVVQICVGQVLTHLPAKVQSVERVPMSTRQVRLIHPKQILDRPFKQILHRMKC